MEATYHVALAALGAQAFAEALEMWADVPAMAGQAATSAAARWSVRTATLTRVRRRQARELTLSYVRLTRALYTGFTIALPENAPSERASLTELRMDFIEAVRKVAPEALSKSPEMPDPIPDDGITPEVPRDPSGASYDPYSESLFSPDAVDPVEEELARLQELIEDEEARAEAETEDLLQKLAEDRLKLKMEKVAEAEAKARQEAADEVGRAASAHVERIVQNGGRYTEFDIAQIDARCVALARVHYPENDSVPCGFCAMLISRGAVYKSVAKAGGIDPMVENDQYHTGCHCRGVPIYKGTDPTTDPRLELNRAMEALWKSDKWKDASPQPGTTGGSKDLDYWRRFMRSVKSEFELDGDAADAIAYINDLARS